jgi:hypothetical protein
MRLISAVSGVQVPASLPDITMPPFFGGFVFLEVTKGILVQISGTKSAASTNFFRVLPDIPRVTKIKPTISAYSALMVSYVFLQILGKST